MDIKPSDEVITTPLSFFATVGVIVRLGDKPVFVDIDPVTYNLDPSRLEAAITPRTRAIMPVHLYGQCADMDPILAACRKHAVPVLEDAAEAMGTLYKGKPAGSMGHLAIFSFNGNKIITTTGGGMLSSARRDWVEKARFWSQQARDPAVEYHHTDLGYNYRLSNVLAGIGRGQLEVLDARVEARRAVAFRYRDAFADLPGLTLMPQAPYGLHTNWLSCFLVDETRLATSRDAIIQALARLNIEARPVWKPMHLQPLYARNECVGGEVAADLYRRGLCLPSSSSLSAEEQATVVAAIRACAGK